MFSLSFPNRVSRLYPLFALTLLLSSSVLLYAWQRDQIELSNIANVEQHQQDLYNQISTFTKQQTLDQAKIQVQSQKITDTTDSLTKIQQQLQGLNQQLTTKNQQLTQAQQQLTTQQDQLAENATELQQLRSHPPLFSFINQSNLPDIATKEQDVKDFMTTAYTYVQAMYGQPYLLSHITISFVNQLSIPGAAAQIVITNSSSGISINIQLLDFNKGDYESLETLVHELCHGFHGVSVLQTSALEEGMTVAATDAIMGKMMADNKIPQFSHLYIDITPAEYQQFNASLMVPSNNQAFYNNPDIAKLYQELGYAWYQFYKQDPNFFLKLNNAYYPQAQKGILPSDTVILNSIRSVLSSVNGEPINQYLEENKAFNPS